VLVGVGDDASVVRCNGVCVTSVDAMVDGVHFRLGEGLAGPAEIGRRALAGALSDLAAMGADPGEAYIVLALPPGFSERRALELIRGALALAGETHTTIAGGDVVASPTLTVSVTAVGWAANHEDLVLRSGARAGDLVGVTGTLGAPAAALAVTEGSLQGGDAGALPPVGRRALERSRSPIPRLREGRILAENGAHAMIDLSDGLASDAARLAEAGGVRLAIELAALPLGPDVEEVAARLGIPPWRLAASGGEDYELLFCVDPSAREQLQEQLGAPGAAGVSWIGGVLVGPPGVELRDERGDAVTLEGYEHRW